MKDFFAKLAAGAVVVAMMIVGIGCNAREATATFLKRCSCATADACSACNRSNAD